MREIRFNPFRYLGIFANATMKEQSAQVSQMKAYARVGQNVDHPLRLSRLLGPLPDDEKAIAASESLIVLPNERERHALFWFAHGPNPEEDLEAIELLNKGWTLQAMEIWKRRDDREALQNLMVAELLQYHWREAVGLAQHIYQNQPNIRSFVLALKEPFRLNEAMILGCVTDNPQWVAVLKEMQTEAYITNIENCLEAVKHHYDPDIFEALYEASFDIDELRDILGPGNATYETLAEQMADALLATEVAPLLLKNPTKWFDRAYEVAVDEETKEFIAGLAVTIYHEGFETLPPEVDRSQIPPLGAYNGPIPELREFARNKLKH